MSVSHGAESGPVEVRIRNDSGLDLDSVCVEFPDQHAVEYGAVPPGGVTDFQATHRAYRYAMVAVTAGNDTLSVHPIDYLGEQELAAGQYTYALGIDNGRLTMHLEQDA